MTIINHQLVLSKREWTAVINAIDFEEEMFFNADKHYEAEQAMREGMVGLATPDGVSWFDPALDFAELDNMIQELSE